MGRTRYLTTGMAMVLCALFLLPVGAEAHTGGPRVQMAILLDTSNSMDGLIDQARNQIWSIVNEMARSSLDGREITLEVALYEYGNSRLSSREGFIRLISPLTTDLDRISEELFRLSTSGGDEYCGRVIDEAVDGLEWSRGGEDLKLIFIAGNEPFTQGGVDHREACRSAIARGIIVNTIFCGDHQQGINGRWKEGADLADGRYMTIDQNRKIVHYAAPQDDELVRLGEELNHTYMAYGREGFKGKARQKKQDSLAGAMSPEVKTERIVAKASSQYRNSSWDLVDADREGSVRVEELGEEELPEEMKDMDAGERRKYVEKMKAERKRIQEKIARLNEDRRRYIAEQKKKSGDKTLDEAVTLAVREQARAKGFDFE